MGFSTASKDSPSLKVRTARYMRGKCGICFKMIMPGEKYLLMDGSITSNVRPVHLDCFHKPDSPQVIETRAKERENDKV